MLITSLYAPVASVVKIFGRQGKAEHPEVIQNNIFRNRKLEIKLLV